MQRKIYPFLLAFALCLTSLQLNAQTYYFDSYGVRDGLAQSKVYCIAQDKDHFLWLGTLDGVSWFDGFSFVNFNTDNGLAPRGVKSICIDSHGTVWLGHLDGGITRYRDKKFEIVKLPNAEIKSDIIEISEDNKGQVWISTVGDGVVKIANPTAKTEKLESEIFKGDKLSDRTFGIYMTKKYGLICITDAGLRCYNASKNEFEKFNIKGLSAYFQITSLFEDRNGNLWLGTYHGGLSKYDANTKEVKTFDIRDGLSSNWISCINQDKEGNIWLGSWGGGITKIKGNEFKIFNTGNGLNDAKIWCISTDVEGNMLIGTTEHGFSIFKGEQFVTYTTQDGLQNPQVWSILQDAQKRFWFGTNQGITVIDPNKKEKKSIYFTQEKNGISNQIRYMRKDQNNNIWIGTVDQGMILYDSKSGQFINPSSVNIWVPQPQAITALEIDRNNDLWVGTIDGLVYYQINTDGSRRLVQTDGLAGSEITALFCDSKNIMWVGSKNKGLTSIQDTSFRIHTELGNITPKAIAEDKNGNLWIGTEGQGVIVFDGKKEVKRFKQTDGLLANLITLINIDKDNNVYIGTNKGLNKIDARDKRVYTYSQKNGFIGIETKENATITDADGNLWFGTVLGATMLNPSLMRKSEIEPLTHIKRIRVNLKDIEPESGISLNYKENSIIFDFTSVCLTNPEAVRYQIMLEGLDKEWQPATVINTVNYSALQPGKYKFKVMARNADGMWNSQPITFDFTINPPFYKTWWFILLCIVVGATTILLYINIRERNLIREKHILEEKVRERTAEVVQKNEELAMKNKDITDSINYAKRIQMAILPPEILFENTFILFKPKDIVSGDFYWLIQDDERDYLAAVDCTGHGVPGAFMSIIGHNTLNKIVKEYHIHKPDEILNRLNYEVIHTLHQTSEAGNINDGMDIALTVYTRATKTLEFAGAYNPLWLMHGEEMTEIKADRFAIGRMTGLDKKFTNNEIKIEPGDAIYLFSDGYADQFGGIEGKKFKAKPMKELIVSLRDLPIEEQRQRLDNTIETWRGDIVQIDDILVIGRRF